MEKYITLNDVTESLKIDKSTLLGWIKKGKFPKPTTHNDHVLIWSLLVIEDWVQQQKFPQEIMNDQDNDF